MRFALAAALAVPLFAYDYGQDITLCWVTNTSVSGSRAREDCAGANVEFTSDLTSTTLFAS